MGAVDTPMHEATFRLHGAGDLARLTDAFDARISLWCNDHSDLLELRCSPADADPILERLDAVVGIDDAVVDGGDVVAVTSTCARAGDGPAVDAHLEEHGCLLVPPLRYADGMRHCRVLALEADRLTGLYRSLLESFDVDVGAKRELEGVSNRPSDRLQGSTPTLSRRQRQVFTLALERGYYEIPREITMAELAAEMGIDRRTADEHRRRAERKLLETVPEASLVG